MVCAEHWWFDRSKSHGPYTAAEVIWRCAPKVHWCMVGRWIWLFYRQRHDVGSVLSQSKKKWRCHSQMLINWCECLWSLNITLTTDVHLHSRCGSIRILNIQWLWVPSISQEALPFIDNSDVPIWMPNSKRNEIYFSNETYFQSNELGNDLIRTCFLYKASKHVL